LEVAKFQKDMDAELRKNQKEVKKENVNRSSIDWMICCSQVVFARRTSREFAVISRHFCPGHPK
jgi:hypothetical protein